MKFGAKWLRLAASVALLSSGAAVVSTPTPAVAAAGNNQCVVDVIGETADKTFIFGPMECFATFEEVLEANGVTSAPANVTARTAQTFLAAAGIIGTHYDGTNASGASFSVSGADCNGGGFNVATAWNDRISSTTNGCPTVTHYQATNYAGLTQSTYGVGVNTNLNSTLNNQTSSIRYYG